MKFSIIVVCLNAGTELNATVQSILAQDYRDMEILVKDGVSTDGSLGALPSDPHIRVISKPDTGIYDAMNQAMEEARGDYVFFLNCGDYLYDSGVLAQIAVLTEDAPGVIYGDILDRLSGTRVASNPEIDEFACYRNVPCHQACFYERKMLMMHPFRTEYRVRADYEQFLWCFFIAKAHMKYLSGIVASYMGGGYSETKENRKRSAAEHKEIVENYMPHSHVVRYRWRMRLSFAHLRGIIARSPLTAGMYNRIKSSVYSRKH